MDLNKKVINGFQYYIKDKIGRGSSSQVFKGLNQKTKQQVAIKVISLLEGQREGHLEVAYAEINVLKKLKGQSNIVQLKNAIETKNNVYIITELCQKGTLQFEIGRGGKMDQARAIKILEDVIEGYKFISAQGIIHRDLKPSNIFQKDKIYKIGDFGYAIENQQCENAKKQNVGSPLYMSPQSLSHNIYSSKSDIWALGIIYYILLTGKSPWKARSQRQLITEHKQFVIQKSLPKNIGGLSRVFLQKTLQKNADERMTIQQLNRWRFHEAPKNMSSMNSLNSILEKPSLKTVRSITTISSAKNNSLLINLKSTGFLPTIIQNQPHDLGKVSQFNKQKTRQTADRTNNQTLKTNPDISLQLQNKTKQKNVDSLKMINTFKNNSSNNILKNQKTAPSFTSRPSLQTIISHEKLPNNSLLKDQKFIETNTTIRVISPPKCVTGLSSPRGSLNIASFQDRQRCLTQINDKQYNILTQVQAQINYFRYLFRLLRKICECLKTKQAKLDEFKNNLLSCIYSKIAQIKQLKHIKGCTSQQKEAFLKSRQYLNILNVLLQYRQKIEHEAHKFQLKIVFVTQRGFINNLSYVINLIYSNIFHLKSNFNILDKKKTLVFILQDLISLSDLFLLCCEQHWQNFRDKCKINDYLAKEYPNSVDSRYLQKVQTRFFELGKA